METGFQLSSFQIDLSPILVQGLCVWYGLSSFELGEDSKGLIPLVLQSDAGRDMGLHLPVPLQAFILSLSMKADDIQILTKQTQAQQHGD